jgi:exodeoxyribonuclease VII large subunit
VPDLFDLPFEDAPQPTPARQVYTVSELTSAIRTLLESSFAEIWVEGEISNCRLWNTGHLYFTLKDSLAQIRAVMFRSALRYLRFKPEDGLHVIARGRISVYEPKGEYQLVCEHLEPHGLGALQLAFDQLKRRLQAEGLFDPARKRPLPLLPRKIGIVTSLDGAAIRDIIKVLTRRYPNAHLVIQPTRVQGEGAAEEIARGLAQIARVPGVDVIIVGRGGGSIEDLWAFNEEVVARAIAASPVPVVSAVGHEVDVTIADFVADVRAPTPSAAAELVVARHEEFRTRIDRLAHRLRAAVAGGLQRRALRLHQLERRPGLAGWPARLALRGRQVGELAHDLARAARGLLDRQTRRVAALTNRLEARDLGRRLAALRTRLVAARQRAETAIVRTCQRHEARYRTLAGRLDALSPLAVLARGYAVCWTADGRAIVRDAATVAVGDPVRVRLHRGELRCRVTDKRTGESSGAAGEP